MRTLYWVSFLTVSSFAQAQLTGIQTGPSEGSSYASSIMTDGSGLVYLVGSTYDTGLPNQGTVLEESSCFILVWEMGNGKQWRNQKVIGSDSALESCHGLGLINSQALALIGNSEPGGLFGDANNKMSGFTAVVDKATMEVNGGTTIQMSDDVKIPYPISVVSDGGTGLYVIALTTTDDAFSSVYNVASASQFPNWIQYEKYGSAFDMTVMKFDYTQTLDSWGFPNGEATLTPSWHQEFPFDDESSGRVPRAYLAGLVIKNNSFLIVAGSTFGKGDGYGGAVGDDEDGFITLLDLNTGELLSNGLKNQERIGSSADDLVTGICDDPNDSNSFYLVGATKGDVHGIQAEQLDIVPGSRQAFIMKMNLETLHTTWTVQWGAKDGDTTITSAYALSCVVSGDTVYVAGQVAAGAGMVQGYEVLDSKGGDDIWVAQLQDNGDDYFVHWVRQIGTKGDDHLARYGGIIMDYLENPIIYGDTTGSLVRNRDNDEVTTDIFFMTLDKDYTPPVGVTGSNPGPQPGAPPTGDGAGVTTPSGIEGVQSGPSLNLGSTYAAALIFDGRDEVYMVGNTYDPNQTGDAESSCFVVSVDLDSWDKEDYKFDEIRILGADDADSLDSCHGLGLVNAQTIMLVGNSEPGGLFADEQLTMTGFAVTVDKNFLEADVGLSIEMSQTSKIPYPISVVSDRDGTAYVIALTSTDDELSQQYSHATSRRFPNWIEFEKYGSSFDMTVMKVQYNFPKDSLAGDEEAKLETVWHQEFPITPESNGFIPRVYLGGIILKASQRGRFLIVAGSTRGLGEGYGSAEADDEDGFLTLLDVDSGDLLQGHRHQRRIGTNKDDLVAGICDNPFDPESFYIVGATKGKMGTSQDSHADIPTGSSQAFIMKIKASDLSTIWSMQLGAINGDHTTRAVALGCAWSFDSVYVAGNVENGAGMVQGQEILDSQGGDDIWVARLNDLGSNFELAWLQQLGTSGDDHLARYGGIIADANGNAIVYGDTTGSMFRDRQDDVDKSDIFVMRLDSGEFATPVAPPVQGQVPVQPPTRAPASPPTTPPHGFVAIGVQYAGPMYAGGVAYDSSLDLSIITGSTYGTNAREGDPSSCYVATVSMNTGDLLSREEYGTGGTDEACSAIVFSPRQDLAYVIGGTQPNGLLTADAELNPSIVQYGMVLQVTDRSELKGFGFDDYAVIQYPVAVVADPREEYIYVASMTADEIVTEADADEAFPNWTSQQKYKADFYLTVARYQVNKQSTQAGVSKSVVRDWFKIFKLDDGAATLGGILTSSMVLAAGGHQLVVVGSTAGSGGPFKTNSGTDMDGWIIRLDPQTGDLFNLESDKPSSIRVDDSSGADDWITATCVDRFDHGHIYIVGTSDEDVDGIPQGSSHAFIAKVDLSGLTRVWRVHLPMDSGSDSPPKATALGCAVAPDDAGGKLYVVGNIGDGAMLRGAKEKVSHGKDDIFIVQFDASNGDIEWARQVGSEEDDLVTDGNPIALDADGNAIVFGDTFGSMYYNRASDSGVSDSFLMTFSKIDGSYRDTISQGGISQGNAVDDPKTPEDTDPGQVPDNIVGLQTGPDTGPSYAGGMVYDRFTNGLYVTGATYGSFGSPGGREPLPKSSCFFGVVILPKLQWLQRQTYGTENVPEACNALSLTKYGGDDTAIVVGSTEKNGLLTQFGKESGVKQYGFALDLSNSGGKYGLMGGAVMDGNNVQYPLAVVTKDEQVWIVSMASDDTKVTADFEKVARREHPNLTTGGIEKYGSEYTLVVEKHTIRRSPESDGGVAEEQTLAIDWRKPLETADKTSVFVSGMLHIGDEIVIVGSTRGSPGGENIDGIMVKVSSSDGSIVVEEASSHAIAYFSSLSDRDDWIMNACADPDDDEFFYIVGATKGQHDPSVFKDEKDLTVHAVTSKISLESLTSSWTKQYTVKHASGRTDKEAAAAALGCAVVPGEQSMYVAGIVENFATIEYEDGTEQNSAGGDDIFVSLVSTVDGKTSWLKQVGSNGDDRVARSGGVKVDANKNAVVFGDTNGSLYRSRTEDLHPLDSDIFLMMFDFRDGKHLPPLVAPPISGASNAPPREWYPTDVNFRDPKSLAFAITLLLVLASAIVGCYMCRRRQQQKAAAQKRSIFSYLQRFDVDDIDLRKSPPGGWNVTYLNKLAYGASNAEALPADELSADYEFETVPLTHSSIVTDSLFVDTSFTPTMGYTDDPTYDDLEIRSERDNAGIRTGRQII